MLTRNAYVFARAILHKELYGKLEQHLAQYELSYPFYDEKLNRETSLFAVTVETQIPKETIVKGTIDSIPFAINWITPELKGLSMNKYTAYYNAIQSFPKEL